MRILADENCDRLIVVGLRERGHEVHYIPELSGGESDEELFALAVREGLTVLTDDLRFGHLAERGVIHPPGIILMRLGSLTRAGRVKRALDALISVDTDVPGHLLVIEPHRTRVRALEHAG